MISDPGLLREVRDRLYELNFDPGPLDEPMGEAAYLAIREYETMSKLAVTGQADPRPSAPAARERRAAPMGRDRLCQGRRQVGHGLGARDAQGSSRQRARLLRCRRAKCSIELSFFGAECAAFAHGSGAFALAARDTPEQAKSAALAECGGARTKLPHHRGRLRQWRGPLEPLIADTRPK